MDNRLYSHIIKNYQRGIGYYPSISANNSHLFRTQDSKNSMDYYFVLTLMKNCRKEKEKDYFYCACPIAISYQGRIYFRQGYLGHGGHCQAHVFGDNLFSFVVLSSIEKITQQEQIERCRRKVHYMKTVYPEKKTYYFHATECFNPYTQKNMPIFFAILPKLPGIHLNLAIQQASSKTVLLEICLAVAQGLQHIHHAHLIHGDTSNENILIDTTTKPPRAYFIDYECSYNKSDHFATTFNETHDQIPSFPPERTASFKDYPALPKPGFDQDIYTLAYWLRYDFFNFLNKTLIHNIVEILKYCNQAASINPTERPTLETLIELLKKEMAFIPTPVDPTNTNTASSSSSSSDHLSTTAQLTYLGIGNCYTNAHHDSFQLKTRTQPTQQEALQPATLVESQSTANNALILPHSQKP